MLTGISMAIEGKEVTLTATDRFRLAVSTLEWEPTAEEVKTQLLIPAKTLQETASYLDSLITDPIEIAVDTGDSIAADDLFGLHADYREITTRPQRVCSMLISQPFRTFCLSRTPRWHRLRSDHCKRLFAVSPC